MTQSVNTRRSWMILPAHEDASAARYQQASPDVAVLDLEYSVPPRAKERARENLKSLVQPLLHAQAEVFVRIHRDTRWADVAAAIQRGVTGIVYPGPDEAAEVAEI